MGTESLRKSSVSDAEFHTSVDSVVVFWLGVFCNLSFQLQKAQSLTFVCRLTQGHVTGTNVATRYSDINHNVTMQTVDVSLTS